jgi:hypothetical protein
VVGWTYETGSGAATVTTTIAVLGEDGSPEPGWPKMISGITSPPTFGEGGSLYVVITRGAGSSALVARLEASESSSWTLPLGGEPLMGPSSATSGGGIPEPPVVGGGMVFVAEDSDVAAFDVAGIAAPGWPYRLPAGWSAAACGAGSATIAAEGIAPVVWSPNPAAAPGQGDGLLYLALEDRIVALTSAGAMAPGWPYASSAYRCWSEPKAAPDGGVAMLGVQVRAQGFTVLRLTIDGKLPD